LSCSIKQVKVKPLPILDWYGAHGCEDESSVFVSFEEFSVEDPPPPHDEVMKTKIIV
tara:strand:- start:691 stop:861 length:171 start_codon:yes stop_codon:yes gene_type:complete